MQIKSQYVKLNLFFKTNLSDGLINSPFKIIKKKKKNFQALMG